MRHWLLHLVVEFSFFVQLISGLHAQRFDYPTAKPSASWANADSLRHHVTYADGSVARAVLLRLNPAGLGPSFAFGFFCTNRLNRPCTDFLLGVAVVYCNSGAGMTAFTTGMPHVVWSANRRNPVGAGSTLQFTAEGDLVLKSANGTVIWSAGTAGRSVAGMSINSDGNLVLFDRSKRTVWQSFDHPTDTLLVGQSLRQGAQLTANNSAQDWSDGRIYLTVADDGLSIYVNARPPQRYYHLGISRPNGPYVIYTNGSLMVYARPGALEESIELPAVGADTVQYMRLEYDGHLRLYEWRDMIWKRVFDVLHFYPNNCAYPTVCGAYGVCTDMQCSCPDTTNFRPVDPRRPSRGCALTRPMSCQSKRAHRLVSLQGVAYFNDHRTSMRALERVSEEACKKACLGDCACMGAQFYDGPDVLNGDCYLQSEVISLETIQPEIVHYNSSMHIKVQTRSV